MLELLNFVLTLVFWFVFWNRVNRIVAATEENAATTKELLALLERNSRDEWKRRQRSE